MAVVSPAAKVTVPTSPVKSLGCSAVPSTVLQETEVDCDEAPDSVTVSVAVSPSSTVTLLMLTSGASMMVTVPVPELMTSPVGLLSTQVKASVISSWLLNVVWRVIVAVVSPAAKVTVPVSAG